MHNEEDIEEFAKNIFEENAFTLNDLNELSAIKMHTKYVNINLNFGDNFEIK